MPITIRSVISAVAREWGVTAEQITGPSREYRVSHPRAFVVKLARDIIKPRPSFAMIGRELNGRDHSTIYNLYHRAPILLNSYPHYYEPFKAAKQSLQNQL